MQLVFEKRGRRSLFILGFEGLIRTSFNEATNDVVNLVDQAKVEDRCRLNWRTLCWYLTWRKVLKRFIKVRNKIFRRVRKISKSDMSFMSVRLTVRIQKLGFHWRNFREIWYLNIFQKLVEKIQVSSKSDENNECFTWRPVYISDHNFAQFFSEWEIFQTFYFPWHIFVRILCRLWANVEKYCTVGQATNDNMTHAHSMLDN